MIIGLSGYARSGKDTIAGLLLGLHGYERVAFAEPIKKLLCEINPTINDFTSTLNRVVEQRGWEDAKNSSEVRRMLQNLGMSMRNMFGDDIWVTEAFKNLDTSKNLVFTDVRFPNEAAKIKEANGQIWKILRPGYAPVNDHPSESAMDYWKYDKILVNNSGLDGLKSQIDGILKASNEL